ncbi:hypothetical protein ACFLWU_05475 [Chloroflexota bacterium]
MSKAFKLIATTCILTVILIVSVAGAAFADNPEKGNMNQSQSGENVCNNAGEPIKNQYQHSWAAKGPHGPQNGKGPYRSQNGRVIEEIVLPE